VTSIFSQKNAKEFFVTATEKKSTLLFLGKFFGDIANS